MNITGTFDGTPAVVNLAGHNDPTFAVSIGGVGTVTVEISLTPGAARNPGTAKWHVPDLSSFTPPISFPTANDFMVAFKGRCSAVRFTRNTGAAVATWEIVT